MAAYRCFVWKKAYPKPSLHIFDNAMDALSCGVEYLRKGYQVRLGEECIEPLESLRIPTKNERKGNVQRNRN